MMAALDRPTLRVLYMESDMGLALMVKKSLTRQGNVVETVDNGKDGLALAAKKPFDVILVDSALQKIDSLDVVEALVKDPTSPPVVIMVCHGAERVVGEALDLGAATYLIKDSGLVFLDILPPVIEQALRCAKLPGRDKP